MASTSASPAAPPRGRLIDHVLNWVPSLLFAVILPYLTYGFLTGRHLAGPALALIISGVWPVLESIGMLIIRRKVDEFGVFVLIMLAIGAISMVAFNSPAMILIKDSAVTGLVGLAFLVSLALPRPLAFYFGRKFATNGSRAAVAYWNGLWQHKGFRHTQRVVTIAWGAGFLGEAVLRIVVVAAGVLPISAELLLSNIFPYVVLAALLVFTTIYSARSSRRTAEAKASADELKRLADEG